MELKPYTLLDIHPCPFYGFRFDKESGIMEETGGNECAFTSIIGESYSSCCLMEALRERLKLNWPGCSLNTKENKIKLAGRLEDIWVRTKEFRGALRIWMRHVMDMEIEG